MSLTVDCRVKARTSLKGKTADDCVATEDNAVIVCIAPVKFSVLRRLDIPCELHLVQCTSLGQRTARKHKERCKRSLIY